MSKKERNSSLMFVAFFSSKFNKISSNRKSRFNVICVQYVY